MKIYSIGCGIPFLCSQSSQTKGSILLRVAAVVTGILLILAGLLIIYKIQGFHQLGAIAGWSCMALGSIFFILGLVLKHYRLWRPSDSVEDTSIIGCCPEEVLHASFKSLDISSLICLKLVSKALYKNARTYLTKERCPLKREVVSDYTSAVIKWKKVCSEDKLLILELCELDKERNRKPIQENRFNEILVILKTNQKLNLLNAVPITSESGTWKEKETYSPLQYWAACGRLDYVIKLVHSGARDYSVHSEAPGNRSALYRAAEWGHLTVVEYLLERGAHAGVRFENNSRYNSFIPDLIYHIDLSNSATNGMSAHYECLKKIVEYMAVDHISELKFQCSIPIGSEKNVLNWMRSLGKNRNYLDKVYRLLISFNFFRYQNGYQLRKS